MVLPIVFRWQTQEPINCDNIIEVAEWANHFSGVNRLSADVGLPLERTVISAYQCGYLFDYLKVKKEKIRKIYLEEGIASILIHLIASWEMTGREFIIISDKLKGFGFNEDDYAKTGYKWNILKDMIGRQDVNLSLLKLSENIFKYQRWILYNHMGRNKRWDEIQFELSLRNIVDECLSLASEFNCDLERGFTWTMAKIQDAEIKRH